MRYPLAFVFNLAFALCMLTLPTSAQTVKEPSSGNTDWTKPYPPFRIAGNLYYVGTYDLACYLITSPQGHILINTGIASSAKTLTTNIESLGFKVKDVRILLTNQAHYDHVGAMAEIKKITGAKFFVNNADAAVMADGGTSDYYFGGASASFQPVKADRKLNNGDTISLGGTWLTMLHHPGHTKGSASYLVEVKGSVRPYRVLIANIPSIIIDKKFSEITSYPGMAKDYSYTLEAMQKLDFDIWVAAHASQFDLHEKRKPGAAYNPRIFADKEEFMKKIASIKLEYDKKITED